MEPITDMFGWTYVQCAFLILDFQEYVCIKVLKTNGMLRQQAGATSR